MTRTRWDALTEELAEAEKPEKPRTKLTPAARAKLDELLAKYSVDQEATKDQLRLDLARADALACSGTTYAYVSLGGHVVGMVTEFSVTTDPGFRNSRITASIRRTSRVEPIDLVEQDVMLVVVYRRGEDEALACYSAHVTRVKGIVGDDLIELHAVGTRLK